MKKVLSLLVAVLMAASLAASAFAAACPSPHAPEVVGVLPYDKDDNVVKLHACQNATVVSSADAEEADPEIAAALKEACASLKAAGSVEAVVPERAGMTVYDVFNISATDHIVKVLDDGGIITVTLDMNAEPGTVMDVIVYADGRWIVQDETWQTAVTVEDNGDINITFNRLGVFALLCK